MPGTLVQQDAFFRSNESCQWIQNIQAPALQSSRDAQMCNIVLPSHRYKAVHSVCLHGAVMLQDPLGKYTGRLNKVPMHGRSSRMPAQMHNILHLVDPQAMNAP